jgi:hypothetical protein
VPGQHPRPNIGHPQVRRRSIVIDRRFRGSADSAQSGYAAGKTASHAEGPVKVTLFRPAPVEQDLSVEIDSDERITVLDGSGVVMEANPSAELLIEVPASAAVIDEIFARGPVTAERGQDRPHCFGCSLERGDGLGLATLPVGTTSIWGTTWTPDESLPSADGFVDAEILWSALDCPGSFAGAADASRHPSEVSGPPAREEMTVQIRDKVRIGEHLAVMGWAITHSDSTVDCGTAIVDRTGQVRAYARLCQSIAERNTPHGQ